MLCSRMRHSFRTHRWSGDAQLKARINHKLYAVVLENREESPRSTSSLIRELIPFSSKYELERDARTALLIYRHAQPGFDSSLHEC